MVELFPYPPFHLRGRYQSLVSPLADLEFWSPCGKPVCSVDTSHGTVFSVSRPLHESQPRGCGVDTAATAQAVSLKVTECPLWHIHFGSRAYVGTRGSSWLLSSSFMDRELSGQRAAGQDASLRVRSPAGLWGALSLPSAWASWAVVRARGDCSLTLTLKSSWKALPL